jgi:excisionase family DNA binding protein
VSDIGQDAVLTAEETAAYLRVAKETVLRRLRDGRLPGGKVGNQWRIRRADLDDHLRGNRKKQ